MVSFVLILDSFNAIWGHLSEFKNLVRYYSSALNFKFPQINVKLLIFIQTLMFQFSHSPPLLTLGLGYLRFVIKLPFRALYKPFAKRKKATSEQASIY